MLNNISNKLDDVITNQAKNLLNDSEDFGTKMFALKECYSENAIRYGLVKAIHKLGCNVLMMRLNLLCFGRDVTGVLNHSLSLG